MKESFFLRFLGDSVCYHTLSLVTTGRLATFRQVKRYLADTTLPLHASGLGFLSPTLSSQLIPAVYIHQTTRTSTLSSNQVSVRLFMSRYCQLVRVSDSSLLGCGVSLWLHDSTGARRCQWVFDEFHIFVHSTQNEDLRLVHLDRVGLWVSGSLGAWLCQALEGSRTGKSLGRVCVWVWVGSWLWRALRASQDYSGQGLALVHARVCMGGCALGLLVALWRAVWSGVVSGSRGLALAVWVALVGCLWVDSVFGQTGS